MAEHLDTVTNALRKDIKILLLSEYLNNAGVGGERGPTLMSSMKVSFADMAWLQKPKRRRKKQRKSE